MNQSEGNTMKRTLLVLLAVLLLAGLAVCAAKQTTRTDPAPAEEAEPAADDRAPLRFRTTDRDGNVWEESAFSGHELTMLNFWEPWCGPCVREMPDLQRLAEAYVDRGFQILGVYSAQGMEEDVDKVLESTGVTYPILHNTEDFALFRSGYVPTTVFLDENGLVVGEPLYVGSKSYEDWETLVLELLG